MKALELVAPSVLELREQDIPVPGPAEARVAVRACGICGSDLHGMDGSSGRRIPPLVMGHEASGVIDVLGPGVDEWQEGEDNYRAFLLRLWQETPDARWRASLQDAASGEWTVFGSVTELIAFLQNSNAQHGSGRNASPGP